MSAKATKREAARGSRLLSVPPEIVNRIFSCLVPEPVPTNAVFRGGQLLSPQDLHARAALKNSCLASKQCHQIAGPLLYRNVTVHTPSQLIKLLYALVLNDMGRNVRHFALVLEDPKESWFDGRFKNVLYELWQLFLRLTPQTRPKFERLYPEFFLGQPIYSFSPDRFFVHIMMVCVNFMTRGQDILLGLPCDVDQRNVDGLPPSQHTYNSTQLHHHSWKSFRLRCDSQFITADQSTFQFLRQLLTPETTRVEVFNYSGETLGWQDMVSNDSQLDTYQLLGDSPCLCRVEEVKVYINNDFDTDCLQLLMDRTANIKRVTIGFPGYENQQSLQQQVDAKKDFCPAMLSRAGQIEHLHLYTQSYWVLPLNIGMLPEYTSLKSLRVDLPLLLGNPDTWDEPGMQKPITTMFRLLPPSIQSLTLKEKWTTDDSAEMLTHKGPELHFLEIYMDGVLSALVEDCRNANLPALQDFALEAYDKVQSSGLFREDATMAAFQQKFRELGVTFHWIWHHDVHHEIKCEETFSEEDLRRWGGNGRNHIYPYYTCDAANDFKRQHGH